MMINDYCPHGSHGKQRESIIVINNLHLTIWTSNSVITQSFRSRELTFCLNFHTAICLGTEFYQNIKILCI